MANVCRNTCAETRISSLIPAARFAWTRIACTLLSHGQKRLASLVAYHSEAQFEAQLRELAHELQTIPREYSAVAAALTYCDMKTGPTGVPIPFEECLADIFQRYDKTHIVNQAIHQALPSLAQAIKQTQQTLYQCKGGYD